MAVATAPAQTIEDRVRQRLRTPVKDGRRPVDVFSDMFGTALSELYAPIQYQAPNDPIDDPDDVTSMWADLRPSQQKRLADLIEGLFDLEGEVYDRLTAAIVQAAETFAAEYPDAVREAVSA